MSYFEPLAGLQDLDTRLAQLDHRLAHMSEREELTASRVEAEEVDARSALLAVEIGALRSEQRRHEDEVASLEEKAQNTNDNMYSGSVTAPKELEAMQEEIASLARRQEIVEDSILELMEQTEPLDAQAAGIDGERAQIDMRTGQLGARIEVAEQEIAAEQSVIQTERAAVVKRIGPELEGIYDKQRASMRGRVAVGRLVGATCDACHLELSAVEVDRVRHMPDIEPAFCPECGALLVR